MSPLPEQFLQRLELIIPAFCRNEVMESFSTEKPQAVRINTLKTTKDAVWDRLKRDSILIQESPVFENVLMVDKNEREKLLQSDFVKEGGLYFQSLSSIAVAKVLDPSPGQVILDMCAAPGSKTSQMAAMMDNQGRIIAVEAVKSRYYRLRSVLELLGVSNVECKRFDARRYWPKEMLFDKILLDAPCSSEGRFNTHDADSFAYWSPRKIKETQRKQKGLLHRGCQLLKPGGVLVYSTCTFEPEENEEVINWVLRKMSDIHLQPIQLAGVPTYPAIGKWKNKEFDPAVSRCVRIQPNQYWDGFFIAKLKRD